jgi:chaperonin GroES
MIEPIGDYAVIEKDEQTERKVSGLVVVESVASTTIGTIRAVGPGRVTDTGDRIPMSVGEGDKVIYQPYAQLIEVNHGDERLFLIRETDILAKVN